MSLRTIAQDGMRARAWSTPISPRASDSSTRSESGRHAGRTVHSMVVPMSLRSRGPRLFHSKPNSSAIAGDHIVGDRFEPREKGREVLVVEPPGDGGEADEVDEPHCHRRAGLSAGAMAFDRGLQVPAVKRADQLDMTLE